MQAAVTRAGAKASTHRAIPHEDLGEVLWVLGDVCPEPGLPLSVGLNKPFLQVMPDAFQYLPGLFLPSGVSQSHRAE